METQRIDYLTNKSTVDNAIITVAGLGSGGFPLVQQLTMCGFRHWHLFDPDTLDEVNLVKHPGLRSQIGKPKVEIAAEWIMDRNPSADIIISQSDVIKNKIFAHSCSVSNLVICAVDNGDARSFINDVCVKIGVPCATGSVFRTGFGGEVYLFVPEETGCFECMTRFAAKSGMNMSDAPPMTADEEHKIYGLGMKEFSASGLSIDIATISSLHAHICFAILGAGNKKYVPTLNFNWLLFGLRPQAEAQIRSRFECQRLMLPPQEGCHLRCAESRRRKDEP